jgi:hypothetical protein
MCKSVKLSLVLGEDPDPVRIGVKKPIRNIEASHHIVADTICQLLRALASRLYFANVRSRIHSDFKGRIRIQNKSFITRLASLHMTGRVNLSGFRRYDFSALLVIDPSARKSLPSPAYR